MRLAVLGRIQFAVLPFALLGVAPCAYAQQAATSAAARGPAKQMTPADLKEWRTIRQAVLSNDGKWLVYTVGPNEGDASLVIRSTGADNKETKVPIGDGAAGAGGGVPVSGDSRWVAYTIAPAFSGGRGGRGAGRGGAGAATTPAAPRRTRWG